MVLEKTLESPLDCKDFQLVHPKGNQSWIFIERTDTEAETLILWPLDTKNWLIRKDPDVGKDWRWEKGTKEDEMVRWHHRLDRQEFEQALGVSWWWTGRPGMLQSMGSQRDGCNWVTELKEVWQSRNLFHPAFSKLLSPQYSSYQHPANIWNHAMGQYHPSIQETFIGQLVWRAVAEIYLILNWHESRHKYSIVLHKWTQYIYTHISVSILVKTQGYLASITQMSKTVVNILKLGLQE